MKKAVVTRAKGIEDIAQVSHPVLREYATRCNADFVVIDQDIINCGSFHYEILQCYNLLEKYDRIIHIDSDVLIAPDCPDLFDVVPEGQIGLVFEDRYIRKKSRRIFIKHMQDKWGDIQWKQGYQNSGVLVCSRQHKKIFAYDPSRLWNTWGYADLQIGYLIRELGFTIFELPFTFNHMSMFSEVGWNYLNAKMIHYAGRGFDHRYSRAEQMKRDLHTIQTKSKLHRSCMSLYPRLRLLAIGVLNFMRSRIKTEKDFIKVFEL